MNVNPWIAALVISLCLVGVGTYAYKKHGLPLMCYKDNQRETLSPGKNNKLVVYHWNCRKELLGIDFGPYGWASTGFEIVHKDQVIKRHSFPPGTYLEYKQDSRTEKNMETPPPVRVVWEEGLTIIVYYPPGTKYYRPFVKGYPLDFREEKE